EADARSNMGHTHNTYRLFPDSEKGTRLEMTFDVHLTGPYRLFAPFARGFIVRRTSREWDDYVLAMQTGRSSVSQLPSVGGAWKEQGPRRLQLHAMSCLTCHF